MPEKNYEAQIAKAFTYHPPAPSRVPDFTAIRDRARELAELVAERCPASREASVALTKIEEAVMWANAAIARE